jgi:mercuric ion transport protein
MRPDAGRLATIGSVVGAILASSCCVLPLILVTLGASGAWIGSLSTLDPYKGYFAAFTLVFLGLGYREAFRKRDTECEDGSFCATPASSRMTKSVLVIATLLVAAAMTIDWWAPLFY